MRRKFLVAFVGAAGVLLLAAVLAVLVSDSQDELATTSVIVEIPDNPGAQADAVAVAPPPEPEPVPPVATDVFIADAIRARLKDPALRQGTHPDDIAAAEAFYASHNGPALWLTGAGISPEGQAVLEELGRADAWGLDPEMFRVPPADYVPTQPDEQAATEAAISLGILKYARAARGGSVDPTTLSKIYAQKAPTLHDPAKVMRDISGSSSPDSYLTELNPKHVHFIRLRQALANAQSDDDKARIKRNMDRWRWMPETLGSSYVWLNIPEFMVHIVKDGKIIQSEKVVVGGTNTPTPVLSADLETIVMNPERVVPLSIIRRDVLPKLQQSGGFFGGNNASDILAQYKITVKRGGRTVDPGTIDWKKVNLGTLQFIQAPGRTNIFGKVQFLYPNERNVFMTDTSLRGQLARDVRADGAPSPRVDNAVKIASSLLADDKDWTAAKVNQLIAGNRTNSVKIDKPVPVHTTYFTVVVDEQGQVQTFDDIYKLDAIELPDSAAPSGGAAPPVAGSTPPPQREPI